MSQSIFSKHVEQLAQSGETTEEEYQKLRKELKRLVRNEMKRKGILYCSPRILGICSPKWDEDAWDELLCECYRFVILDRQKGLWNQLRVKGEIEPMIIRNVQNSVFERQRKADRLGHLVYTRLRRSVKRMLGRTDCYINNVLANSGFDIDNKTIIAFRPGPVTLCSSEDLELPVSLWLDELLLDLVTSQSRAVEPVVEALTERISLLPQHGISAFSFGVLAKEMTSQARCRWGMMGLLSNSEQARVTNSLSTDRGLETIERPKLIQYVDRRVASYHPPSTQEDLNKLWVYLKERLARGEEDGPPSYAEIGRTLDLDSRRVSQLFQILKEMFQDFWNSPDPSM